LAETIALYDIAHARSGDKGAHANIALIAYTDRAFDLIRDQVTAEFVQQRFAQLGCTKVERYELAKLKALNFILRDALDGGGSRNLRIDAQGKTFGQALLTSRVDLPDGVRRADIMPEHQS
jgi:hypothetical protein